MNALMLPKKLKSLLVGGIFIICFLAVGCSTPPQSSPLDLTNSTWEYQSGLVKFIPDNRFSANFGCNTMSGTYQVNGSQISLKPGPTTKMACLPDLTQRESAFIEQIQQIQTASMERDKLVLSGENVKMILTPPVNSPLQGRQWALVDIKDPQAQSSAAIDEGSFIQFQADGKVTGQTTCNSFMGNYQRDGANGLSVTQVVTTRKMCDPERMQREQQFLGILAKTTQYRIEQQTLLLSSADDVWQLRFQVQPEN